MTSSKREFARHVRKMKQESQGILTLALYNRNGLAEMLDRAIDGDPYAEAISEAVSEALRQVKCTTRRTPLLCLTCDNRFSAEALPSAFTVLHASRDDPHATMINGICPDCYGGKSDEDLMKSVTNVYRKKFLPDLRELPPMSAPGRA